MADAEDGPKLVTYTTPPCLLCEKQSVVQVPEEGFNRWRLAGVHIQNALPELSAEQRELLMTGTHPKCWDAMFPEED